MKETPFKTQWVTKSGTFLTLKKCAAQFFLPEFDMHKYFEWSVHVDEKAKSKTSAYDLIIGSDLMGEPGLILHYQSKVMTWAEVSAPMKDSSEVDYSLPEVVNAIHTNLLKVRVYNK